MALIKKPGSKNLIFQASVKGKKWCRSTGCSDLAKAKAMVPRLQKLAALHRGQPSDCLQLKNAIVAEVNRLELDVSESQAERVGYALANFYEFAGDIALERVDDGLLRDFMRHRIKQNAAKSTVKRELCYVARMLRENDISVVKPVVKVGKTTESRPFTDDELRRFFAQCDEQNRVLFMTMLMTGARPAELIPSPRSKHVALLKEEVQPEQNVVMLRTAKLKAGEPGKVRPIRVPEDFMEQLVQHGQKVPGQHVFLPNQSLHNLFDRILKRAGIPKHDALGRNLTAHSFRHTFATRMAAKVGQNAFVLQAILGHSTISMTEKYCHLEAPSMMMTMPDLSAEDSRVVEVAWWKEAKTNAAGAA